MAKKDDERSRVTIDELRELVPADVAVVIESGLIERQSLKLDEERIKGEVDRINSEVLPTMMAFGIGSVVSPIGSFVWQHQERKTLNKDALINALLLAGVSAKVIAKAIDEATETKEVDSLTYRRPTR